jgi:hypothetical protein
MGFAGKGDGCGDERGQIGDERGYLMPKGVYKRTKKIRKVISRGQKKRQKAAAEKERLVQAEVPAEFMPLHHWIRWHYGKQVEYIHAQEEHWETVFLAGNGTGKTHILYWCGILYALGIHPHQFAQPPLAIKVLVNDFEHGFSKIFRETCLSDIWMPERYDIYMKVPETGKWRFQAFFCDLDKAKDWCRKRQMKGTYQIKPYETTVIKPMLAKSLIAQEPSRDDRTLRLKNGSFFFFQTSEQRKKLHSGTNFDLLLCDEEPVYQIYDESVRGMRTAKGGGRILHAFTPPFDDDDKNRGPTWTKDRLIDSSDSGENPDVAVVRAAMAENPAITDEFIKKFSRGKTEDQLKIQLYGEYPTWGKLIFPDFQPYLWIPETKHGNLLPHDFEVPWGDPDVLFEMAIDWHRSKAPAVVWTFEYLTGPNKGDVVVFSELSPKSGEGLTISDTCQAIREVEGWRRDRIRRFGDPKMKDKQNELISGFSAWKEFAHCGIRLTDGWNRDPYVTYSIMSDFLRGKSRGHEGHPRLFIKEDCKTLIYNMKNHYNVMKGDGTANPDPKFSDYIASLKYIMQGKSRKIKKNMERRKWDNKWKLTSYGGDPAFGPYMGHYTKRDRVPYANRYR